MFTFALWIRSAFKLHWLEIISRSLFWGVPVRLRFRPSFPTAISVAFLEEYAVVVLSSFSLSFPSFYAPCYFSFLSFLLFCISLNSSRSYFYFCITFLLRFSLREPTFCFFVFPRQCEYTVVNFTHGGESLLGRSPRRFEGINIFTNWGYGRPRVRNYLYFFLYKCSGKVNAKCLAF